MNPTENLRLDLSYIRTYVIKHLAWTSFRNNLFSIESFMNDSLSTEWLENFIERIKKKIGKVTHLSKVHSYGRNLPKIFLSILLSRIFEISDQIRYASCSFMIFKIPNFHTSKLFLGDFWTLKIEEFSSSKQ